MKEIIINQEIDKETVALLENGKLVELYEDDSTTKSLEGNIYCGIVRDILPGIQSAFIDIGERKKAFIHIKDIIPKKSNETGNKEEKLENYKISNYIQQKMPMIVQVKKTEENQKGARVSKHINITGKYVVLMPNSNFVTLSQKIDDPEQRKNLKEIGKELLEKFNQGKEKYGFILRTASINIEPEIIKNEAEKLIITWKNILRQYNKCKDKGIAKKIYESADNATKVLNSLFQGEECEIFTNNQETFEKIKETMPNAEMHLKTDDIMSSFDLQEQIERTKQRKIWLNCGGFITIDKTEALTAIDVNSGKYVGKKHDTKDNTTYKVNREATVEIAKQIRLRNISGIIVIDYINMEKEEERNEIINLFSEELKKDRSKTQICGFTNLDLLEMTRKRL